MRGEGAHWSLTLVLHSICFLKVFFFDFSEATQREVKYANGTFSQVEGVGKVSLILLDKDGIEHCVTFSDCRFRPDHSHVLIIVNKLRRNGAEVNFGVSLSIFVNGRGTIPIEEHAKLNVLKGTHLIFVHFPARTKKRCCRITALVTTISNV